MISSLPFFRKAKRKQEILNFLNQPNYYKQVFPFPCSKEEILIHDNFELFELIFLDHKNQIKLYDIFEIRDKKPSFIRDKSRNNIFSWYWHDLNAKKLKFKNNFTFISEIFEKVESSTLNIFKYSFNNMFVYHIDFYFGFGFTNCPLKDTKKSFHFLVKEKDLENFKDFIQKEVLTYNSLDLKIQNSMKHF